MSRFDPQHRAPLTLLAIQCDHCTSIPKVTSECWSHTVNMGMPHTEHGNAPPHITGMPCTEHEISHTEYSDANKSLMSRACHRSMRHEACREALAPAPAKSSVLPPVFKRAPCVSTALTAWTGPTRCRASLPSRYVSPDTPEVTGNFHWGGARLVLLAASSPCVQPYVL